MNQNRVFKLRPRKKATERAFYHKQRLEKVIEGFRLPDILELNLRH